jgi:hypothetical protein
MDRFLPEPASPLATFCLELIQRLEASYKSDVVPEDEKALELTLLWATVDAMEKPDGIDIRRHPWGRREFERGWATAKAEHCADVYGMRHTADMYILMAPYRGISVDVKLAKMRRKNTMPNAEIQTLIGQCTLSKLRHDYAIGVFGHCRPLHQAKWHRDTLVIGQTLARHGIFLVFKDLSSFV